MPHNPHPVGPAICRRRSLQAISFWFTEPHPQFDTVIETHDVQRIDISGRADDTLAQAEADRKILQIVGCRHHYRIGPAIIRKRYRGLFRDRTTAEARDRLLAKSGDQRLGPVPSCIAPFSGVPRREARVLSGTEATRNRRRDLTRFTQLKTNLAFRNSIDGGSGRGGEETRRS